MGLDLYPKLAITLEEDKSPDQYAGGNLDAICEEIQAACKGWGTDEDRLLKAMGAQTPETRCKVPLRYKEMFGKELKELMKSECGSRDFGTALQFLAVSPIAAECLMIERASKGFGTDEKVLASILCGRTNKEMTLLKKKYFEMYTKDLGQVAASELSGKFEHLLLNVMQADEEEYDPAYHNDDKMADEAAQLYNMGQGKMGSDEVGLFKILCRAPPEYLKKLNIYYAQEHGYTLPKVLEKELSDDLEFAASFMLGMKLKPYETLAGLINEACNGFGTKELLLTTALIRYQQYMKEVNKAHEEDYGKSIEERVKSECGGDYRKILLQVVQTGMSM